MFSSSVLFQPRVLCQTEVRMGTEISKYFFSIRDTKISHLLISVIILIPNDNSFLSSPASMQEYDLKNREILFCLKNMVHSSILFLFFFFSSFPSSCPKRIMGLSLHLAIHNSLIYFSFQTTTIYDLLIIQKAKGQMHLWCDC